MDNASRLIVGKITGLFMEVYYVYVLQSESTGQYYVGHTKNLEERVKRHRHGRSRFTKWRGRFKLAYIEEYRSRSAAAQREAQIKARKSRSYIQQLISRAPTDSSL